MALGKYDLLKEQALVNFELLLAHWKIDYIKIGDNEYDFLSPTRDDNSFGACRFNVNKGVGADFAGGVFKQSDYNAIGTGFTSKDFTGFTRFGESRTSFDIIGLTQRVHNIDSYASAAEKLKEVIDSLRTNPQLITEVYELAALRHATAEIKRNQVRDWAANGWRNCGSIKGTVGEHYLNSRSIKLPNIDEFCEPNLRFHHKIYNTELKLFIPALVFKVSIEPDGPLKAIHRIWIAADGSRKARLEEPKKALGSVDGAGIWLGTPCAKLCIAEGPETALDLRYIEKYDFVVSTVYANNYAKLTIPECVQTVVLAPDTDAAGEAAREKAVSAYRNQGKQVKILFYRGKDE